jgi:hypothetical protein
VLARLEAITGVRSASVDAAGEVFVVMLDPGAPESDVEGAIVAALARDARRLTRDEVQAELGPPTRRELWFGVDDLATLSYLECRLVAARVTSSLQKELDLGRAATERLSEAVREEMFSHVDRIHAGRFPSGRFLEAWPDIARRAVARCTADLSSGGDVVLRALLAFYSRQP